MTKEMIENSSVEQLMAEPVVKNLGTVKNIRERDSLVFYRKLQSVIDSKEKVDKAKPKDSNEKPKPREPALWPLIKAVRLYVKHPALATERSLLICQEFTTLTQLERRLPGNI